MATLAGIWIKRAHKGPMDAVRSAALRAGRGLVGSADQGGKRQVTLIDQGMCDELATALGADVEPGARRANLLIDGLSLAHSRGRVLRVGPCRVRIYGETRPCEQMDAAQPGLRGAMARPWGGGAFGEVLDDGEIEVGVSVEWES